MASVETVMRQESAVVERLTRVETTVERVLPHFATKADVQRQTKVLVMWIVGIQIVFAVIMILLFGVFFDAVTAPPTPQLALT